MTARLRNSIKPSIGRNTILRMTGNDQNTDQFLSLTGSGHFFIKIKKAAPIIIKIHHVHLELRKQTEPNHFDMMVLKRIGTETGLLTFNFNMKNGNNIAIYIPENYHENST
jgi:hypothetical protein